MIKRLVKAAVSDEEKLWMKHRRLWWALVVTSLFAGAGWIVSSLIWTGWRAWGYNSSLLGAGFLLMGLLYTGIRVVVFRQEERVSR